MQDQSRSSEALHHLLRTMRAGATLPHFGWTSPQQLRALRPHLLRQVPHWSLPLPPRILGPKRLWTLLPSTRMPRGLEECRPAPHLSGRGLGGAGTPPDALPLSHRRCPRFQPVSTGLGAHLPERAVLPTLCRVRPEGRGLPPHHVQMWRRVLLHLRRAIRKLRSGAVLPCSRRCSQAPGRPRGSDLPTLETTPCRLYGHALPRRRRQRRPAATTRPCATH